MKAIVYNDWQNLRDPIGEGELLEKIEDGLPFILDEAINERFQKLHYCALYRVRFSDGFIKNCCILREKKRRVSKNNIELEPASDLVDTFLVFNDKEIY